MENNRLPYNYWPIIKRPQLKMPESARIAVWFGLNIESYDVDKPSTSIFQGTAMLAPDPLNYGWRDYSVRVGIWRMMDLFDKYKIRPSCLINSDVCINYPDIIEEGNKRGWIWVAHGKNNSTFQANMDYETEYKYLKEVVSVIEKCTKQKVNGWLGPALTETFNTPPILAKLGATYLLDWCNDDQPYPLNQEMGKVISVPYSIEINDIPLFVGRSLTGDDFLQILKDHFDVLYEEGKIQPRIMAIALHPFIIGQPFRIKYLEKFFQYVQTKTDVWMTDSDSIAEWYLKNHYDQSIKLLNWRDLNTEKK
jgi:peptidoglycan/xylan/chitin deacetylase (PgdA/CDA1 family)